MSITPKVSIVVPVFNREKYLRRCVDSICAQTLREIEIILVDDGSTDSSPMICDDYAARDARVQVIHRQNAGMGAAYNAGMAEAKGEYIGFVETDDWIESEMYNELYAKAVEHNVDVVKSFYISVKNGKRSVINQYTKHKQYFDRPLTEVMKRVSAMAFDRPSVWSGIYRRRFLEDRGIKYPETEGASMQDLDFFWLVFTQCNTCTILPKAYYNCNRDTPDSSGSCGYRTILYLSRAFDRTLALVMASGVDQIYAELLIKRAYDVERAIDTGACRGIMKFRHARLIAYFRKYISQLELSRFSDDEKKEFLHWIKHPYLSAFGALIYTKKVNPYSTCVKFLGLKLYEKKKKRNVEKKKVLYIPIRKRVAERGGSRISYLGIPMIRTVLRSGKKIKYFLGVPYSARDISPRPEKGTATSNSDCVLNQKQIMEAVLNALATRDLHRQTFAQFRDIYTDRDIVLVGCGPTLKFYKQINNAIHIGVNRAFLAPNVQLDYLFMQDFLNIGDIIADACEYRKGECRKFFGMFYRPSHHMQIPDCWAREAGAYRYYVNETKQMYEEKIYYNIENYPLAQFWASGFQALHFAFHTSPRRIFLVGFDCNFTGYFNGQPQKFDVRGKKKAVTEASAETTQHIEVILDGFKKFKRYKQVYYPRTEVISINPVGLRGLYEDTYTKEYIMEHSEILDYEILEDYLRIP